MYVTAHRVLSARNAREGINAFLHLHGRGFPWPDDAVGLPETNPGRLEDEVISVRPGGNRVRAYLDILAPDGTPTDTILAALDGVARSMKEQGSPLVFSCGKITIRFGVELGLLPQRMEQFSKLLEALRPLLMAERGRPA